ncbi:SDR family mycofactocin-dependent oxidoreductase [Rhodococcus sp. 06-156-3C]|uniref:mycofactocin-coupled SDR family oxidoreductase n=1 Tax=Nocardiaceae TaxID=85025 RepID=UPI00052305E8|nr:MULTISPECIES: mycofactocin-coupled SDR family oxidoreductase [Rhodococcus]OZD18258.1 SDR family mycofactocin-dependent oxidoreductase [Rhodococcus sp. 06-156-4C]OZD18856.1 SDR family mycofactocin-dependent oxidoreductase [Rhodococcus sp. 06-156-3C]OZD22366.1 SDR family mycofactocin-dependent oxidoreductase [Rhodococcus sp. 06-156-4a]OZD33950.1 SDR family mycofactocin-dependent oxidoreductase [Rhodococcus sp. 06-156-3b]OZD38687.1 SDR family mycofactocin-dependent oxidoreductase [Rhodococcus 
MQRFKDKVVLITGAARGQGRSHAIRFAEEGANIIALDGCAPVKGTNYEMATREDLDQTVRLVEKTGARIIASVADVRSQQQLDDATALGVREFGRIDVVIANAGIFTQSKNSWEMTEDEWSSTIDVDLSGVWRTCKSAVPTMIAGAEGGSIIITASSNGYRGEAGHPSYNAAKLGLVGLMRTLAGELGDHSIRVNTIHPTNVKTAMMWNDTMVDTFIPGETTATINQDSWWKGMEGMHMLPIGAIEPEEVSDVVLFLASSAGKHITASEFPIDAGYIRKN